MVGIIEIKEIFSRVFQIKFEDGRIAIATETLVPGLKVYDEKIVQHDDREYRIWNPYRSKLAAAILNGIKELPIKPGSRVLYLGIASGTTASHISDIIGENGIIYGIEFAHRPFRDLIKVAENRKNIVPLLKDARLPESFSYIGENVDILYADLAQPNQAQIFLHNAEIFLKENGYGLIAIKARSIDVTKPPDEIFEEQREILEAGGMRILKGIKLDPYAKDHIMFLLRYQY